MSAKRKRGRLRIRIPEKKTILPPAADNEPKWKEKMPAPARSGSSLWQDSASRFRW
ncbi:MAG: hypothetical protein QM689_06320 [Oscillospiraceae bacterium]